LETSLSTALELDNLKRLIHLGKGIRSWVSGEAVIDLGLTGSTGKTAKVWNNNSKI